MTAAIYYHPELALVFRTLAWMVKMGVVASGSQYLVTHNVRDLQRINELGVIPVTPSSFLALLRSTP